MPLLYTFSSCSSHIDIVNTFLYILYTSSCTRDLAHKSHSRTHQQCTCPVRQMPFRIRNIEDTVYAVVGEPGFPSIIVHILCSNNILLVNLKSVDLWSLWSCWDMADCFKITGIRACVSHAHRCQPSRNRAGNPAFRLSSRIFVKKSRIFRIILENIKFSDNRYNFQSHKDILWTEAMRKCQRRAPAMFSTPGDKKVNGNMVVKAPHSAIWCKNASSFDVREEENRACCIFPHPCWHIMHACPSIPLVARADSTLETIEVLVTICSAPRTSTFFCASAGQWKPYGNLFAPFESY